MSTERSSRYSLGTWQAHRPLTAANVGLEVAMVLLAVHGWSAGWAARLRGRQPLLSTSVAAALGIVMMLLKDLVLLHLH